MKKCADALADSLEQGARALADVASALTTSEWQAHVPRNGSEIGAMVDHLASVYGQLTQTIAGGEPVAGVTGKSGDETNAGHAEEHDSVTKEAALDLLRRNSSAAAAAIRALSDEELDQVALC
ncbi:MAG TPA: DinB family protein [Gemmatimonadaceae bacterium]|nr:DinB family protein [Gemmatimonadaceae bacterium]